MNSKAWKILSRAPMGNGWVHFISETGALMNCKVYSGALCDCFITGKLISTLKVRLEKKTLKTKNFLFMGSSASAFVKT